MTTPGRGRVVGDLSISLDGFVAGPGDAPERALGEGGERLHAWLFAGDRPHPAIPFFRPVGDSRTVVDAWSERIGALVVGRRTFDLVGGWGGRHPFGVPFFVLTHRAADGANAGGDGTFVAAGFDAALARARVAARGKDVFVGSADAVRQGLRGGGLDALHLHLVPVLLGGGTPLFQGTAGIELEPTEAQASTGVTHLRYEVARTEREVGGFAPREES